jgi:coenzyme F420-0:L-glutamate ligase / coenzyme F420-1:gamma-L-glutamate ligase
VSTDPSTGSGRDVRIIAVAGIPEVHPGDDLAAQILRAAKAQGLTLEDGDLLVVTQKVVSKAEGRILALDSIEPGPFALQVAEQWEKDARVVEIVLRESRRVVRMDHGVMICETKHGLICANAGVDSSNVEQLGTVALLPVDPDASAEALRKKIEALSGASIAVVITDTFGRPWREGHVNFAIGVAGMLPLHDYTGQTDPAGYELRVTSMAVADELAAAAELAQGKLDRVPVAIVRGYDYPRGDGSAKDLLRDPEKDLFR